MDCQLVNLIISPEDIKNSRLEHEKVLKENEFYADKEIADKLLACILNDINFISNRPDIKYYTLTLRPTANMAETTLKTTEDTSSLNHSIIDKCYVNCIPIVNLLKDMLISLNFYVDVYFNTKIQPYGSINDLFFYLHIKLSATADDIQTESE